MAYQMPIEEAKMRRMAFIRYLMDKANEEATRPQPNPSASILTFHDAIELYLYLSAEHLDISKPKNIGFMEYWERISSELSGDTKLSHKESMERLNRARRNLKHAGNRPHSDDVLSFRVAVSEFVSENTPKIFGINYEEISLTGMVQFDRTRDYLQDAESFISDNEYADAIEKCALAFESLRQDLRWEYRDLFGFNPFFSTGMSPPRFHRSRVTGQRLASSTTIDREVGRSIETLQQDISTIAGAVDDNRKSIQDLYSSIESIGQELEVIGMGIDYLEYSRFRRIAPPVVHVASEEMETRGEIDDEFLNEDEADFCIRFVLDSALNLQDMLIREEAM